MTRESSVNANWSVVDENTGVVPTWERAGIAVLMDIRTELQRLNNLLSCPNFTAIPGTLRTIAQHTTPQKPRKRKSRGTR